MDIAAHTVLHRSVYIAWEIFALSNLEYQQNGDAMYGETNIDVVIPCFLVNGKVLEVIGRIGPEVRHIIVVDDCCPEAIGDLVEAEANDARCLVLRHLANRGVGGAVVTGYRKALSLGADIVVKVDGDGQMAPELIPHLIRPILMQQADYTKGSRFHSLFDVQSMPKSRLFGNAILSLVTKVSSGYWSVFDPTNGFTAIHSEALGRLSLDNLSERYFFESDMLINLGTIRAVVRDVPMRAKYADEVSGLKISRTAGTFMIRHVREFLKRIVYNYFLRDFSLASLQLAFGMLMLVFGISFGAYEWWQSAMSGIAATTGTVMISVLPIILGFQLLISFLSFDIMLEPQVCLQALFRMKSSFRFDGMEHQKDLELIRRRPRERNQI